MYIMEKHYKKFDLDSYQKEVKELLEKLQSINYLNDIEILKTDDGEVSYILILLGHKDQSLEFCFHADLYTCVIFKNFHHEICYFKEGYSPDEYECVTFEQALGNAFRIIDAYRTFKSLFEKSPKI